MESIINFSNFLSGGKAKELSEQEDLYLLNEVSDKENFLDAMDNYEDEIAYILENTELKTLKHSNTPDMIL